MCPLIRLAAVVAPLLYLSIRFRRVLRRTDPDATFAEVGEKGYAAIDDPLAQWIDQNYGTFLLGYVVLLGFPAILVMILAFG